MEAAVLTPTDSRPHPQDTVPRWYLNWINSELAIAQRALELHAQQCTPETAHNIREQARAEAEGREPRFLPAACSG